MKEYIKRLGSAFVILIVGLCPMLLGVIYLAISSEGKYFHIIMSLSLAAGAFLCSFVMKRQYNMDIRNYIKKPKLKTSVLIVITALAYEMTALLTVYKPMLSESTDSEEILAEIAGWIAAVIFSPAAEEIIFRFSLLSILLVKKSSILRTFLTILMVSVIWSFLHFSAYLPRIIDIVAVGMIIGYIFTEYNNIFYCIFFHAAANFTVRIPDSFLLENEYILYISLPLCLLCIFILFSQKNKLEINPHNG